MSSGINLPSPQSGRAESTADRIHSRAVAAITAETQPKGVMNENFISVLKNSSIIASHHIKRHGFDLGNKTWVHHGEPALPSPPPVIDNIRQSQMSDMTTLLNDFSYIPSNNEHDEPTKGDIGETSNEPTQVTRNEFEELYASANEELYPGCDYVRLYGKVYLF
nr:hypothetical protein [Tanacetum cinerariifolium]